MFALERKQQQQQTTALPPTARSTTLLLARADAPTFADEDENAKKKRRTAETRQSPPMRKPAAPTTPPVPSVPAQTSTHIASTTEMTMADHAMALKQRQDTHQYTRRWQTLLQWVTLAKIQQQYLATTVRADVAGDLARSGKF